MILAASALLSAGAWTTVARTRVVSARALKAAVAALARAMASPGCTVITTSTIARPAAARSGPPADPGRHAAPAAADRLEAPSRARRDTAEGGTSGMAISSAGGPARWARR